MQIVFCAKAISADPIESLDYNHDGDEASFERVNAELVPQAEGRILGLFKGWKGDDDGHHPLSHFGKIHIIKKGWGDDHKHGHGSHGWGWGHYGPGHTTYHYTSHGHHGHGGWKAPLKKSWFHIPKKTFGIEVKGTLSI